MILDIIKAHESPCKPEFKIIVKKINIVLTLILVSFSISFASARTEIQALVKKYRLSDASIGIAAQRVNSGKMLYRYADNRSFTPASNNKIFTAIGAFSVLPKNFQFQTAIYYQKSNYANGTLNGNLYIEFSGDPSLTGAALYNLISRAKQAGIKRVNGSIIVVANKFSGSYIPKGWSKEDAQYCFAAPASTLNMNKNCVVFKIVKSGSKDTRIKKLGNTSNITFKNTAKIAPYSVRKSCPFSLVMDDNNVISLTGCLPQQAEFYMNLAIKNPALKTLDTIKDFVKEVGIQYTGDIQIGSLPKSKLHLLVDNRSESIDDMLTHMLLKSDNLYAESFLRTVGYDIYGIGSTDKGTAAVKKTLHTKYGADITKLTMDDGSGLSFLDKVTPNFMVNLLTKAYNSPIGKKFYRALPTSATDGTLAYRMNGPLRGRVHAKTGTLSSVFTLSGYLLTKKNHLVSFSIMLNDLKRNQRNNARAFQDRVVKVFYNEL